MIYFNKLILTLFIALNVLTYSQPETVTVTYKYILGDNDTRNDAKKIALIEAKRLCIEKAGTVIESKISRNIKETTSNEKSDFSDITSYDVNNFVGALIKVDIIEENFEYSGNTQTLTTTVKAIIDINSIAGRLKQIKNDDDLKNQILKQQESLKDLQNQITLLQKKLTVAQPEKANSLRDQRTEIFHEIDELESIRINIKKITKTAVTNIDIGMIKDDVIKVAGKPRSTDSCSEREFWNFGDVWVMFSSGVVSSIFDVREYRGACWYESDYRKISKK